MSSFLRKAAALNASKEGVSNSVSTEPFVSTGVPSLDKLVKIQLGNCVLIVEDGTRSSSSNYASMLLKCMAAEGLALGQSVCILDLIDEKDTRLCSLPLAKASSSMEPKTEDSEAAQMTIAWRYRHMADIEQVSSVTGARTFDLGSVTDRSKQLCILAFTDLPRLVNEIRAIATQALEEKKILRLLIRGLGSPLMELKDSVKLLYGLRRVLAELKNQMVIVATVPAHRQDQSLYLFADRVLSLKSIAGTAFEDNQAMAEYGGFLSIVKSGHVTGSMAVALPPATSQVYRLKRRSVVFEPFHLPPALADPAAAPPSTGCSSSSAENSLLSF